MVDQILGHLPKEGSKITIQADYVRSLFTNLENGRPEAFFDHVAQDVTWTVMGTHPLAGTYHTKAPSCGLVGAVDAQNSSWRPPPGSSTHCDGWQQEAGAA